MSETNDLRSYLSALDALGDIQRITRVIDPNLEAAAVTRRSTENGRPAPFFQHLSGVGEGFRMIGAPGALSSVPGHPLARVSLSLGLPYTTTAAELVEHLRQAGTGQLIPPRRVAADSAPCKQNILTGKRPVSTGSRSRSFTRATAVPTSIRGVSSSRGHRTADGRTGPFPES